MRHLLCIHILNLSVPGFGNCDSIWLPQRHSWSKLIVKINCTVPKSVSTAVFYTIHVSSNFYFKYNPFGAHTSKLLHPLIREQHLYNVRLVLQPCVRSINHSDSHLYNWVLPELSAYNHYNYNLQHFIIIVLSLLLLQLLMHMENSNNWTYCQLRT